MEQKPLELLRLAKQKASKIQSAQALLEKASSDPKVRKQLKPKRGRGGRGRGRGAGAVPKTTLGDLGDYQDEQDEPEVENSKDADQQTGCEPMEVPEKIPPPKASPKHDADFLKNQWAEKDHCCVVLPEYFH